MVQCNVPSGRFYFTIICDLGSHRESLDHGSVTGQCSFVTLDLF